MSSLELKTRSGDKVNRLGYGLMNFTWRPTVVPDDKAFEAIKAAIDGGSNMLNSGEFYGGIKNLELINRFFKKYPEYSDKVFVSVKGGVNLENLKPDSSYEGLLKSVTNINTILGRKMDLFESARVDRTIPIEEAIASLSKLQSEGHFDHIGLSEVSAPTIRKAAAAGKISAVEVEYSPWSLDVEGNGVLQACKDLGIPLVAYSPLGRGFLTGSIKSIDDIPEGDMRRHLDRFQPENFHKNLELVESIKSIAQKKGITPAQLSLAWLMSEWEGVYPIPGSTRVAGVQESLVSLHVKLSSEDRAELRKVLESAEIVGGRYNEHMAAALEG